MGGNIFQIIPLKLILIVSVAEAEDVVEVHILAEYPILKCYISALVILITVME